MALLNTIRKKPWFAISVALHLLAIVVVFSLPPVRKTIFQEKNQALPKANVSEKQIENVHEKLKKRSERELQKKLERLEEIQTALEKIEEEKKEELDAANAPLKENAKEEALAAMQSSLDQMDTALASLQQTQQTLQSLPASLSQKIDALPPAPERSATEDQP